MESTGLLALIFGLWAAVVIPLWWRERQAGSSHHVAVFRSAMERLREGQVMPGSAAAATVEYKRSPRAGHRESMRQRSLRRRRITFLVAVATFPIAAGLQIAGLTSAVIWVLPLLAAGTFVSYARYSLSQVRRIDGEAEAQSQKQVETRPTKSLAAGLAAMRRITMRRLVETEPKVKTEETAAWQPASELGSPWSAPAPILPSYVSTQTAPVADEEVRALPGVDGKALIEAARVQRDLAALAAEITGQPALVFPDDDTSEIQIIGA